VSEGWIPSPAKLNLFLAVVGRRPDGFHDLVSVAAPLAWGDRLRLRLLDGGAGADRLLCDDPAVPVEGNLVLAAARAFREAAGWKPPVEFTIEKRIPMGAGLGGGSSNAAAALRGLNALAGEPLDRAALRALSAGVGSDCPLFLEGGPVVVRGRGERVAPLPPAGAARLRGRKVLLFKPAFEISTAWAYARLASAALEKGEPMAYMAAAEAEARLAAWTGGAAPAEDLLFNSFEAPVFSKFPAMPVLLRRLKEAFGLETGLSGSGSACFTLLPAGRSVSVSEISAAIRSAWGPSALVVETVLA
jgi:4-diphosphocytidyl-2-C-methyl-D-erythritol kinase